MSARTIYFIKRVEVEVTNLMTKYLEASDITPSQYTVLSFLGHNSSDLSSAQLSRRFHMTPQSMNEIVSTLQKKGLIEKNVDPNHKRILRLNLTPKGEMTLKKCEKAIDEVEKILVKNLTTEELDTYRALMGKVIEATHEVLVD